MNPTVGGRPVSESIASVRTLAAKGRRRPRPARSASGCGPFSPFERAATARKAAMFVARYPARKTRIPSKAYPSNVARPIAT